LSSGGHSHKDAKSTLPGWLVRPRFPPLRTGADGSRPGNLPRVRRGGVTSDGQDGLASRTIVNKEFITIFSDGGALITGTFKAEVENLETGETIAVNASGPGKITPDGSVLRGTGRWLLFGEAGFFGPGAPPEVTLVSGQFVAFTDAAGNVTSTTRQGHIEDLCAALAD
jgi:hypothetical protein